MMVRRCASQHSRTSTRRKQKCRWHYTHLAGSFALLVLMLVFVACDCTTPNTSSVHAGPTPNTRATQTVHAVRHGPAQVQVSVLNQQGSVAAQKIILSVQVIVTNHTTKSIWLYGTCPLPFIALSIAAKKSTTNQTVNLYGNDSCPVDSGSDDARVTSNGLGTWQFHADLYAYNTDWQPGIYTLTATVPSWHQGTLDQISTPDSGLLQGAALGQTSVTLS